MEDTIFTIFGLLLILGLILLLNLWIFHMSAATLFKTLLYMAVIIFLVGVFIIVYLGPDAWDDV